MNITFPTTEFISCVFPKPTAQRNAPIETAVTAKSYTYKLLPGMDKPKVGDLAVVACATGLQVAVVKSLNAIPYQDSKDASYVVGFVDPQAYRQTLDKEAERKKLYATLMAKKKELDKTLAFEVYAEKDPEFKELLDLYKTTL